MIRDTLANSHHYQNLPDGVPEALDYLRRTDFARTADGQYELDGDRLVAIVKHCRTRPPDQAVWETHRRHIDVHYMLEGVEDVGYLPWHEGLAVRRPYDAVNDGTVFDARGELFEVPAGSFVVFTPDDVHAADVCCGETTATVRKVVIKCRIAGG